VSASVWSTVKLQHALQEGRDLDGEQRRDAETAERITAEADAAIAYDHASHGCPYVDGGVCPVCDSNDTEIFI